MNISKNRSKEVRILKTIESIDRALSRLPKLNVGEKKSLQSAQRFDAVYYSNRLEGNKLSRSQAKKAVAFEMK